MGQMALSWANVAGEVRVGGRPVATLAHGQLSGNSEGWTYRATITDRTPWLDPARPGELRRIIGPRTYRWRQQDAAQGYTWTDDGDAITITGHGAPEAL